jgi:16S rRNA G527 N7-methylase RsmG
LNHLSDRADDQRLTTNDLQDMSTYIDLLLRWNARINLTAIRQPAEIVTRHLRRITLRLPPLPPSGADLP